MKCQHYKGEGYTFDLEGGLGVKGESLDLCYKCYISLLIKIAKQTALEIKIREKIE